MYIFWNRALQFYSTVFGNLTTALTLGVKSKGRSPVNGLMLWILMYSSRETDTIGGMRFGIIFIDLMLCELVNRRMDRIRLLFLLSFTLSVTAVPVYHENNAVYKCPQLETLTNQRLQ